MEFLKKHYEKMVLCVVLLGLAAAVLWMKSAMEQARLGVANPPSSPPPKSAPPPPLNLSSDEQSLAQITNPPPVVLSGAHNLFNPVTWKRKANGDLVKFIKTGAEAMIVTNITPLYLIISYQSTIEGPLYVMGLQQEANLNQPNPKVKSEYLAMDEKKKGVPFIVRGIKGAPTNATEINLELTATGETNVWVSANHPYQQVRSYLADLKYDPESLTLLKKKVNYDFVLDNEPYIIVEITNDAVRVKSRRTTKVTEIKWTKSP